MTIHPALHAQGCGCDAPYLHARPCQRRRSLDRISAHAAPRGGAEQVPFASALGRGLSRPVLSTAMVPSFDNATQCSALIGPAPCHLRVIARVSAGQGAGPNLSSATAARIFTGAPSRQGPIPSCCRRRSRASGASRPRGWWRQGRVRDRADKGDRQAFGSDRRADRGRPVADPVHPEMRLQREISPREAQLSRPAGTTLCQRQGARPWTFS